MKYIPPKDSKISVKEIEHGFYYWVFEKICDVLFSGKYNNFCVTVTRSMLDFLVRAKFLTGKQIRLLSDLRPSI